MHVDSDRSERGSGGGARDLPADAASRRRQLHVDPCRINVRGDQDLGGRGDAPRRDVVGDREAGREHPDEIVAGREVANLLENEYRLPGRYEVKFDGRVLASGVYMYRLVTGGTVETRKMVLVR